MAVHAFFTGLNFTEQSTILFPMGRQSDAKEKILQSAQQLLHTRSYASVGVQEICAQAGVKKGSFYHFFPSKQALTQEVLAGFEHNIENLFRNARQADSALAGLEQIFEQLHHGQLAQIEAYGQIVGCPFGNLATELSTQDDPIRQQLVRIFSTMESGIADLVQQAIDAGSLTEQVDSQIAASAFLAYIEGIYLLAKTYQDSDLILRLRPSIQGLLNACQKPR